MTLIKQLLKSKRFIQFVAILLIVVGLVMTVRYAMGLFEAYRAFAYAQEHNFEAGNPDPDLIRPWMNLRYVAVAYTVPQEFLFAQLDIPMDRRNSNSSLNDLNEQYFHGRLQPDAPAEERGTSIAIIEQLQQAITSYRQNPVSTGLQEGEVYPWMSIEYISNSTGIPADYIFEQLDIPQADNGYKPLVQLNDELKYPGGPRALAEAVQRAVNQYEAQQ